jgi:hypothetical protein
MQTCFYHVRFDEGVVFLAFQDPNSSRHEAADVESIIVPGPRNSIVGWEIRNGNFTPCIDMTESDGGVRVEEQGSGISELSY